MKSSDNKQIHSEWEDNILFDVDDPDFNNNIGNDLVNGSLNSHYQTTLRLTSAVPTNKSFTNVQNSHLTDICSSMGNALHLSSSSSSSFEISKPDNVLTIEELRAQLGYCFSCGVSWTDYHVSLDCTECGGYSKERPCPLCDGNCGVLWKRDFTMSHALGKARWQGTCSNFPDIIYHNFLPANFLHQQAIQHHPRIHKCGQSQLLAQELCVRLEQLSATTCSIAHT